MTRVAHLTDAANEDLRTIAVQIGVDNGRVDTSIRMLNELTSCCNDIARLSPGMVLGTAIPVLGTGVRLYHHRRWIIIYRYVDDGILVYRVADGAEDYLTWKFGD